MVVAGHASAAIEVAAAIATAAAPVWLAAAGLAGGVAGWLLQQRRTRRLAESNDEKQRGISSLEQRLTQAQELYRGILESTPAGMARIDAQCRILNCNPAFLRLAGYHAEGEVAGRQLVSLGADEASRSRLGEMFQRGGQDAAIEEVLLQRGDGEAEWFLLGLHGGKGEAGGNHHAVLISLKERKEAEKQREEASRVLQGQLEDAQRAYRVLEKLATGQGLDDILQWLVLDIEATNEEFRGSVLRLVPGKPARLAHIVAPHLRTDYARAIEGVAIGPGVGSCGTAAYENRAVLSNDIATDGKWDAFRHLIEPLGLRACWSIPIRDRAGSVTGTLAVYSTRARAPEPNEWSRLEAAAHAAGVAIEMDRRMQRERDLSNQLQHVRKMEAVGRLAGGIAHDFNNLLTVILGHTQRLNEMNLPGDEPRASLQEIQTASERAVSLVRQLLTFSRHQSPRAVPLELNELVRRTRKMLQQSISEKIRIEMQLDETPLWMRGDAAQLEQVVMNLLLNARDALPDGGAIFVQTESAGPSPAVRLRVRDTGHGMDEDTVVRIFEPFFTTKPTGQGAGLGLATVYAAVQQNDGQIRVSSEPGRGTEFVLEFPRMAAPAEAPVAAISPAQARVQRGHESILLVEDEPAVRQLLADMLSDMGYRVQATENGAAALVAANASPGGFDLLISDVVMPGMSGPELARQFQQMWPATKLLFISGFAEAHIRGIAGRANLLPKPFTRAVLAERVRQSLDDATSAVAG